MSTNTNTNTVPLTAALIKAKILATKNKGQFITAYWRSEPTPAAAHKGVHLLKITKGVVRSGIDYAKLTTVKEAIANGERGEVEPLPWGVWKDFPYIIEHKGKEYLRLYPSPSESHRPKATFFVEGVEVDRATFATYLTPSNAKKLLEPEPLDCFTIAEENLIGADDYLDIV